MEWSILSTVLVFSLLCSLCLGDIYLHNPRGSNNRLNERTANRQNANRAFDSQNNNRGGYNVGDKTDRPFNDENGQHHMVYFQSGTKGKSYLTFEWTNQHGGGTNNKLNSNLVLQFMCQKDVAQREKDTIRNGRTTSTQSYSNPSPGESFNTYSNRKRNNNDVNKVLQESWDWYDSCYKRDRNKGLFTADQKLKGDRSIYTRQNPQGTRRGYECPEERDYYPYWHPTEWKDIAVLTSDTSRCDYYKKESFNVKPKGECAEKFTGGQRKNSKYNNKEECEENGGTWTTVTNFLEKATKYNTEQSCKSAGAQYTWGIPLGSSTKQCLVKLPEPECSEAPWSRVNHLGNTLGGQTANYTWTIPHFPSGEDQRCVFRMRYNISTDDYDPWDTDSSDNNLLIENDPEVDIGVIDTELQLAINTAQFGRTFQDRSHLFKLRGRKKHDVPDENDIYNLNVRGKRGNIVQVYPAVEYDFVPKHLNLTRNSDMVHIQWAGSNTHNNQGQGDDGEGTTGTDRSNIVESAEPAENHPIAMCSLKMFKGAKAIWTSHNLKDPTSDDIAASMASAGYYSCAKNSQCGENKAAMNSQLNNAPASYPGMVLQFDEKGCHHYICTRNNNFSNRSQKGTLCIA